MENNVMANDTVVTTKVEESVSDDFIVQARAYGFDTRAEFLRFLILRELYGAKALTNTSRTPGAFIGTK
jgi:hypothetical protein